MNSRKWIVVLSCALLVALLLVGAAAAQTTRTYFTGTETQIGGGDPLAYWEAGKTAHIRGLPGTYLEEADDSRASGINHVVNNLNFHPPSSDGVIAEFWGTYTMTNDALGGQWIGKFQGQLYYDGSSELDAHGNGAGAFAGLKMRLHSEGDGMNPASFTGYILEPGG